jgi:hypothetical protein
MRQVHKSLLLTQNFQCLDSHSIKMEPNLGLKMELNLLAKVAHAALQERIIQLLETLICFLISKI